MEFSNNCGYGKRQRGGNNGGGHGHRGPNRDRNDRNMRNNPRPSMGGNRDFNKFGGGGNPNVGGFSHSNSSGNNEQPRYQGNVGGGMPHVHEQRSNGMMSRFSSGKYLPNGRPSRFSDNIETGGQGGQSHGQGSSIPPRFHNNPNQMRFSGQQMPHQPHQFAPSNNFAMNFNPSQTPLPVTN